MRISILIVYIICFTKIGAQSSIVVDTFMIRHTPIELNEIWSTNIKLDIIDLDTLYYKNNKLVDKRVYNYLKQYSDSIEKHFSNSYCKFFVEGQLVEEGLWTLEGYRGTKITYYSDGKIRNVGKYNDKGFLVGWFIYYKKNGKCRKRFYGDDTSFKYGKKYSCEIG